MISTRQVANPSRAQSHIPRGFHNSYEYLIQYESEYSLSHQVIIYVPQLY
jgi:hypothetical protein